MKKIVVILLAIMIGILIDSCAPSPSSTSTIVPSSNVEGATGKIKPPQSSHDDQAPIIVPGIKNETINLNTILDQNNHQNSGDFCFKDGWIYGRSFDDDGNSQFVKTRGDLSDWVKLDDGHATDIYVIDGNIYYMLWTENEESCGIYKMKMSGDDRKKLSDTYGSMQINNNLIYFSPEATIEDNKDGGLYSMDLNGENLVKISDSMSVHWYVFENSIIYQNGADNFSLHVCDISGNNDIKLNNSITYMPIYDGEYIYYISAESLNHEEDLGNRSIKRIKIDGFDDELLSESESVGLLLYEDYIYFINSDDSFRVYRMNKDGSGVTMITQDSNVSNIQIIGESLKYTVCSDNFEYILNDNLCNLDGSNSIIFEKMQ